MGGGGVVPKHLQLVGPLREQVASCRIFRYRIQDEDNETAHLFAPPITEHEEERGSKLERAIRLGSGPKEKESRVPLVLFERRLRWKAP